MPIYKVTTEGDCEGRTIRDLGYVKANSMEHALRHLYYIGLPSTYRYTISTVDTEVREAIAEEHLTHLSVDLSRTEWDSRIFHGTVTVKPEVRQQKRAKMLKILNDNGLTVEDVINLSAED